MIRADRRQHAAHDASAAQMPDERSRIHVASHWNVRASEEIVSFLPGAPIARDGRELADDQTLDIRLDGLAVERIRAVVADLRSGENNNLTGVRRIGEDLLIAG